MKYRRPNGKEGSMDHPVETDEARERRVDPDRTDHHGCLSRQALALLP